MAIMLLLAIHCMLAAWPCTGTADSLNMVSMALLQVIRALTPAFTVMICFVWQNKR